MDSRQTLIDIAEQLDVHFHAVGNVKKQDKWDEAPKHVPKASSSFAEADGDYLAMYRWFYTRFVSEKW